MLALQLFNSLLKATANRVSCSYPGLLFGETDYGNNYYTIIRPLNNIFISFSTHVEALEYVS
jgi:hypothetical protein